MKTQDKNSDTGIKAGIVAIRLTGTAGSSKQAGQLFRVYKDHPTRAYYTETQAIAAGYFILASEIETKAFEKGATRVDLDKRKFSDKTELQNVIALKAKIRAGKAGGDISDAGKSGRRKYHKWTSSDVSIVMGAIRGAYDINNNYINKKVVWSLAKQLDMTEKKIIKSYKDLLNPNNKMLKKYTISRHNFDNIKPIKSKYSTESFDLFMVTSTVLAHEKDLKKALRVFRNIGDDGKSIHMLSKSKGGSIAGRALKRWTKDELRTMLAIYKGGREIGDKINKLSEKVACFVEHSPASCIEKYNKRNKDGLPTDVDPIYVTDNLIQVTNKADLDLSNGIYIKGAEPVNDTPKREVTIKPKALSKRKGLIDELSDRIDKDRYRVNDSAEIITENFDKTIAKRVEMIKSIPEPKPEPEQSVIVQAVLLLTTKLSDAEKLTIIDHIFD